MNYFVRLGYCFFPTKMLFIKKFLSETVMSCGILQGSVVGPDILFLYHLVVVYNKFIKVYSSSCCTDVGFYFKDFTKLQKIRQWLKVC